MSKLKQLQNHLLENGWDAAFITTPDNVFTFPVLEVSRMNAYLELWYLRMRNRF